MPKPKQIKIPANRKQKEKLLISEVKRSLLLTKEEKKFWTEQASSLPDQVLENTILAITTKNRVVDKYTKAALAKDKDHILLTELNAKVQMIKRKAFSFDEESQKTDVEKQLSEELQDI